MQCHANIPAVVSAGQGTESGSKMGQNSYATHRDRSLGKLRGKLRPGLGSKLRETPRTMMARGGARQAVRRRPARRLRDRGWSTLLAVLLVGIAFVALTPSARGDEAQVHPRVDASAVAERQATDASLSSAPAGASELPAVAEAERLLTALLREGASPTRPVTLYEQAAIQYGVSATVLRALHNVESTAASDGCLPNMEGSGALGPFQFKPSTFRAYGVDADGDGRANICGFVDSLFSAAYYLQILGADADPASGGTRRALARYGTDVTGVVSLATWWENPAHGGALAASQ